MPNIPKDTDVDSADPVWVAVQWFVMFQPADKRRFWSDWLSPLEFQHVCAFTYSTGGERWVIYDVNRGGTALAAVDDAMLSDWITYMRRKGAKVLQIEADLNAARPPFPIGLWCVTAIRHALGIRSRALRPIGLYRDLRRLGAKDAFV